MIKRCTFLNHSRGVCLHGLNFVTVFIRKYLLNGYSHNIMSRNNFEVLTKIYKVAAGHTVVSSAISKIIAFKDSEIVKSGNNGTPMVASQGFKRSVLRTMTSPTPKKLNPTVKIGTHSGVFHCDDAFAVYLLKRLPQYKHAEIIRTRNPDVLQTCDIVVDVGGEYNPSNHRYDHHQRSFNESMNSILKTKPWTIKLSSAGLIFCHFGMDILKAMVPEFSDDEKFLNVIFDQLYINFVMEIDAIDNGISMFDGEPKYIINTNISSRVAHINPTWNAPQEDEESIILFSKAMELVGKEFQGRIDYYSKSWWPARCIILKSIQKRFKIHESGEIMELTTFCPWKEHFFDLIKELKIERGIIKIVIFPSTDSWRVQAVPVSSHSFVCHRFLLEPWRGLRNEELSKKAGIEDCIFAHANGFIGGHKTREGALKMAVKCIEAGKQPDDKP